MTDSLPSHSESAGPGAAWLARVFRPRELFIRVDGRVRYVTLSVGMQKLAALVVAGIGLWTFVATAGLFVQEFRGFQRVGSPAAFHAIMPPAIDATCGKPACSSA